MEGGDRNPASQGGAAFVAVVTAVLGAVEETEEEVLNAEDPSREEVPAAALGITRAGEEAGGGGAGERQPALELTEELTAWRHSSQPKVSAYSCSVI